GSDERQMREALGEIADLATPGKVVFLGEQPERGSQRQEPLEELLGPPHATSEGIVVGKPEAAGQERALRAGQAVDLVLRRVTAHEPIAHQRTPNSTHTSLSVVA